jgi:hypothetical protein
MSYLELEPRLEAETIELNCWLYDESVGLPVDGQGYAAPSAALARLYAQLLEQAAAPLHRFALENWAEARLVPFDQRLSEARDAVLTLPDFHSSGGLLTWRNWKAFERETDHADRLAEAFERMVELSEATVPTLEARLAQARADYAAHGLTPVHTFAWREGTTPEALRALLVRVGQACREPFRAALNTLSHSVFGREAGPQELRALYLNRMYEPTTALFVAGRAESAETKRRGVQSPGPQAQAAKRAPAENLIQETQSAFREIGFDLSGIPVDVENRPRKYPGAFCFPVAIPRDVRVSVRIASPHHLVDMLYHEFGHAAHFSGIRADLPFVDRYWIHSGTHETFSTLFESLLHEPAFLRAWFPFDDQAAQRLAAFGRFKALLTGTWLGASALTVLDGWLENLSWPEIEARYAEHVSAFTGVPMPPGFARLEPFTAAQSVYPAGYVLAAVRVAHWLEQLRRLGGEAWWRSPAAQADIREKIGAGGRVQFPEGWGDPLEFLRACGAE